MIRVAFFIALFLSGCAVSEQKLFEIKMMSGETLYARAKPTKDDGGFYYFQDINKQTYIVEEKFILYITPSQFKR